LLPRPRRAEPREAARPRRRSTPRSRARGHPRSRARQLHQCTGTGGIMTTAVLDDVALYGRSMLLTSEWSRRELEALCDVAAALERRDRLGLATPLLPNELHYALFFDNSTRT